MESLNPLMTAGAPGNEAPMVLMPGALRWMNIPMDGKFEFEMKDRCKEWEIRRPSTSRNSPVVASDVGRGFFQLIDLNIISWQAGATLSSETGLKNSSRWDCQRWDHPTCSLSG